MAPEEGDVYTYERTFTEETVRQFGELSGDQQAIHTEPDEQNRLVVQGLLTATLPTKIGGDLGCLARAMEFDFHSPVYTGETVTCEWTNEHVDEREDRYDLKASIVCHTTNELVMSATVDGLVWK
ncbi:MaoC/PaaZ C-terminal domain-containing protein [Halocatena marina]|uniref:MaoC/PaaZ C-terminal domain-containing protein n=1 Tax=Halocatena marina TaxID=2934937 RepID=A0ABD5YSY5_9EURY|nr:MaoC/PaaZ C-terminal domain-containing protein [Halocatena marina]